MPSVWDCTSSNSVTAQAIAPTYPIVGDAWWNTTDSSWYYWSGTAWVKSAGGGGGSGVVFLPDADLTLPPAGGAVNPDTGTYIQHNGAKGLINAAWTGVSGDPINPEDMLVYDGSRWIVVRSAPQSGAGVVFLADADLTVAPVGAAATPVAGNIVQHNGTEGVLDAGWTGVAGDAIKPEDMVIYDGAAWVILRSAATIGTAGLTFLADADLLAAPAGAAEAPVVGYVIQHNGVRGSLAAGWTGVAGDLVHPEDMLIYDGAAWIIIRSAAVTGLTFLADADLLVAPSGAAAAPYAGMIVQHNGVVGSVHASWTGVGGDKIKPEDLVIYDGAAWIILRSAEASGVTFLADADLLLAPAGAATTPEAGNVIQHSGVDGALNAGWTGVGGDRIHTEDMLLFDGANWVILRSADPGTTLSGALTLRGTSVKAEFLAGTGNRNVLVQPDGTFIIGNPSWTLFDTDNATYIIAAGAGVGPWVKCTGLEVELVDEIAAGATFTATSKVYVTNGTGLAGSLDFGVGINGADPTAGFASPVTAGGGYVTNDSMTYTPGAALAAGAKLALFARRAAGNDAAFGVNINGSVNNSEFTVSSAMMAPSVAGHIIFDETTQVPQRPHMRFVGEAVKVIDLANETVVTVTGGGLDPFLLMGG